MPEENNRPDATHLHYRLTHHEWLEICHKLKPADIKLLYYLRTLDPFGDRRLDLGVREIAHDLNCDPGTISRSLRRLADEKLIDLEILRIRVRVQSKNLECEVLPANNTVVPTQQTRSVDNTPDLQTTSMTTTQHPRSVDNNRPSKRRRSKHSDIPQTIHTDQTNQPLSHSDPPTTPERELLEFVIRSLGNTDNIRNPRAYALTILERDRPHWEERFAAHQQLLHQTAIPPPSSPDQNSAFDERQSLIGLINLKRQHGQPITPAIQHRAAQLGIELNPSTP